MKHLISWIGIVIMLSFFTSTQAQVKIAFVGNSITMGLKLTNPSLECYPSQVNLLLKKVYGDTCQIFNSGVSGRTMLKSGDHPIWNESLFKSCYAWTPDICYIMLGTNDSKTQNWESCGAGPQFLKDFKAMIDTFRYKNPDMLFIVAYPPPAIIDNYRIRDSVIHYGVMPVVDSIVGYANAELVDLYHPLLDSAQLFTDGIHPDATGAKIIANIIFDTIINSDIIHKTEKYKTLWECTNQGSTSFIKVLKDHEFVIYPNPLGNEASLKIFVHEPSQITINDFDMGGRLYINQTQLISSTGNQGIALNTSSLSKAYYLFNLGISDFKYSGIIFKD